MPAIAIEAKDETRYAYAVGRIRVLETRLLDRSMMERLVDVDSVEEVLRILADTEYAEAINATGPGASFDDVLAAELERVYSYVRKFTPDKGLMEVLALRFDLHNLKVFLKEKHLGGSEHPEAVATGASVDPAKARAAILAGRYKELPEEFARAAGHAAQALADTGDPRIVDLVLDREIFETGLAIARESGFDLLEKIWTTLVDVINIKTLVRVNRLGRDREFLKDCLINGGLLSAGLLMNLHGNEPSAIADALRFTPYAGLTGEGLKEASRFEMMADDFIMGMLKRAKYKPLGPEPLIAYLLAKETEIRNLRIIMTGKSNGLPAAAIRERLRDTYV